MTSSNDDGKGGKRPFEKRSFDKKGADGGRGGRETDDDSTATSELHNDSPKFFQPQLY